MMARRWIALLLQLAGASWRRLVRRLDAHEETLVEDIAGLGMIVFFLYIALLFTGEL